MTSHPTDKTSAMIKNPPPWPNGARCAVAFSFDVDADSVVHINHPERVNEELHALTYMRYDPLVAVPRLVDLFNDAGVPVSYFVPGWVIERYPAAVECIAAADNEVAHHGYLHESPNQQTEAEERRALTQGIEIIEQATGRRPVGYRAPYYGISQRTLDLLIEAQFEYDSSLFADDVPADLRQSQGHVGGATRAGVGRRLQPVCIRTRVRLPHESIVAAVRDGGVSGGVRCDVGVRRTVGVGVAPRGQWPAVTRPRDQRPGRVHARQGRRLVRHPRADCRARARTGCERTVVATGSTRSRITTRQFRRYGIWSASADARCRASSRGRRPLRGIAPAPKCARPTR